MAANTAAIYTRLPRVSWIGPVVTANTTKDLTSGTIYLVATMHATEPSFVKALRVRPLGTNVATVLRVFINNNGATGTAANNTLFTEVTCPITTVSEVAALTEIEIPMNVAMQATYRIYVTTGTTVAAGFAVTAILGDY
jgi:hypothetical protein